MTDHKPGSSTLHILNKAPDHPRFNSCLQALSATDAVVLTENAVLACADTSVKLPEPCYAMAADIEARGLQGVCENTQLINYGDLVRLTEQHDKIISW